MFLHCQFKDMSECTAGEIPDETASSCIPEDERHCLPSNPIAEDDCSVTQEYPFGNNLPYNSYHGYDIRQQLLIEHYLKQNEDFEDAFPDYNAETSLETECDSGKQFLICNFIQFLPVVSFAKHTLYKTATLNPLKIVLLCQIKQWSTLVFLCH